MFDYHRLIDEVSKDPITVISLPIIAALIGWITNYIAVKMIFRPRKVVNILGLKLHGLVPRRQRELAESIGETVQRDLVSHKDVEKVIQGTDVQADITSLIDQQVDGFVQRFLGKNPMVAMFLQGEMLASIKKTLAEQMQSAVPDFLEKVMARVENNLDFKEIVRGKIESFDLSQLEDLIYRISAKELKTIEILGGVLGFIVGLVQVAIMLASRI